MHFTLLIKLFRFCVLAALLLICAPSALALKSKQKVEPSEGFLVARVINASGDSYPFNTLALTPKELKKSKKNELQLLDSLPDISGSSSVFIAKVPVGEYSVDSIRSFVRLGDYYYSLWALGNIALGTFTITKDEITDLGTFVYSEKVQGDKYTKNLSRIPNTNNDLLVRQFKDSLAYDPNTVHSWNKDDLDSDRQAKYFSLVQNPTYFSQFYKGTSGSIFALSKLGSVLELTSTGAWNQFAIETNSDLKAIVQNKKGDILVGGEFGSLFIKVDKADWKNISLSADTEIKDLELDENGEALVYAIRQQKGVLLRGKPAGKNFTWEIVCSYSVDAIWRDAKGDAITSDEMLEPQFTSNRSVVDFRSDEVLGKKYIRAVVQDMLGYQGRKTKRYSVLDDYHKFHYAKKVAGEMDFIKKVGAVNLGIKHAGFLSASGDLELFTSDNASGEWTSLNKYIDLCPNCKEGTSSFERREFAAKYREPFRFISSPVFIAADEGYAIVQSQKKPPKGQKEKNVYLISTNDLGKTWLKVETTLPGNHCYRLINEITDRLLLSCSGISGDFYESTNKGLEWKHVREHGNY